MVSEHVPLPQERLLQFAGGCPAGSGTKRTGRGRTSKSAYGGGTAAGGGSADDPAVHADPLVNGRPECAGLGGQRRGPAPAGRAVGDQRQSGPAGRQPRIERRAVEQIADQPLLPHHPPFLQRSVAPFPLVVRQRFGTLENGGGENDFRDRKSTRLNSSH